MPPWEGRPSSMSAWAARSSLGDERRHARWKTLHDRAGEEGVQGRGCGTLPKAPDAPHPRQVARRMGRLADPSRTGRKGFPGRPSGFSGATGATALLYAPDLNPEEGIWKHLECVELKNLCCQSLAELKVELRKAKER